MRSNVALRIKIRLSAAGAGVSPLASSAAKMNASKGVFTHPRCLTWGIAGSPGLWNAQKSFPPDTVRSPSRAPSLTPHGAPIFTQAVNVAISSSVNLPVGGIRRRSSL